MPNFPFFRLPFPNFYSPYYNNNYYTRKNTIYNSEKFNSNHFKEKEEIHKNNCYNNKKIPPNHNSSPFDFISGIINGNTNSNDPIFEILGIELYLDDIIILGLLFILYKEGVKDETLFLALILLLLT